MASVWGWVPGDVYRACVWLVVSASIAFHSTAVANFERYPHLR